MTGLSLSANAAALNERRTRLYDELAKAPWAHDFFALLRQIDALSPGAPRFGSALRPNVEALRLGQEPELDFAPAALMSFQAEGPHEDQFAKWVSALFGQAPAALRHADAVPDAAKRFVSGQLARSARSPEAIMKVLRQYFSVPIRIEPYVG